ncbi:uncharacterized protein TRIVIDRAFT_217403 [Trichoderma virens Gv29-8]|uniref:Uncharacterized protein n=1 Tax=Hypocrea virens (strain Gv29-8 / FGSC 10586) TaxID=413071 RepID=G9MFP1_HYPVG|nr:uncharacterized protein TRIVIDRAFT_217403 [Trichoderma virens Gv29-8]EHK26788.1 hypothetical protein TRIVIDRAFT_217403 [Trichoderma virens Gv29-8]UKZ57242.1 hypothetical protein TrVGV298_011095 [Trichoderma virens]
MSQSRSTAAGPNPGAPHYWKPCALVIGENFFGGSGLGIKTQINTAIHIHRETEGTSWLGFTIEIPFGESNEDDGFGVCHTYDRVTLKSIPVDRYKIEISFSLDSAFTIETLSDELEKMLPPTDKKLSWLEVHLKERPTIKGFGMPFANRGHPSDGFVNHDGAIYGKMLVEILQQDTFQFVVAAPSQVLEKFWVQQMPDPFRYPYGEVHFWDMGRYDEILPATKGSQFTRALSFDNDNEHLAALSQSQVQDIMWVYKTALEIAETPLRAYFIPTHDGKVEDCKFFYVIVPLGKAFLEKYEETWRRLTKGGLLKLNVWDNEEDDVAVGWDARIQEASRGIEVLERHPSDINDLVLYVRRPREEDLLRDDIPVKVFGDRRKANLALQNDKEQ